MLNKKNTTNLIKCHTKEKHHHVYNLVHDDASLKADEEEHPATDVDPVLIKHGHECTAQDIHHLSVTSCPAIRLIYNTQTSIHTSIHYDLFLGGSQKQYK